MWANQLVEGDHSFNIRRCGAYLEENLGSDAREPRVHHPAELSEAVGGVGLDIADTQPAARLQRRRAQAPRAAAHGFCSGPQCASPRPMLPLNARRATTHGRWKNSGRAMMYQAGALYRLTHTARDPYSGVCIHQPLQLNTYVLYSDTAHAHRLSEPCTVYGHTAIRYTAIQPIQHTARYIHTLPLRDQAQRAINELRGRCRRSGGAWLRDEGWIRPYLTWPRPLKFDQANQPVLPLSYRSPLDCFRS